MHHDPPPTLGSLADYCRKDEFAHHPSNPLKKSEIDWIFKCRATNGFAEAFVKVNDRKFLVHVPGFLEALAARRGS
jgi:hypothetical protein